ncbi:MAG: CoA-binding protein [Polyangiales bacterium]
MSEKSRVLTRDDEIGEVVRGLRRVAVLGIRSERYADRPAHYVPAALARAGVEVVPVPVHEPDVGEILGRPVVRDLALVGEVDLVNIFRRPDDLMSHLDAPPPRRPPRVWLQSGIRHEGFARALVAAGVSVIEDRCLMVEHRRHGRS